MAATKSKSLQSGDRVQWLDKGARRTGVLKRWDAAGGYRMAIIDERPAGVVGKYAAEKLVSVPEHLVGRA